MRWLEKVGLPSDNRYEQAKNLIKGVDKETTPNEAVSNKTLSGSDGETIPNEPTLNEIPNKVASSGVISNNAESNEICKPGTGVGSFRPW